MAEALAVVGLVSNILQFVDFANQIVSISRNVRDSKHGRMDEVSELTHIVSNVQSSNARVRSLQTSGKKLSQDEMNILNLVKDCEKLADKIRGLLRKLQVRDRATSKTWEEVRISIQSYSKQKELAELRTRLEVLDSMIRYHLAEVLQSRRHSVTKDQLDSILVMQQSLGIDYDLKMDQIRSDLIQVLKQSQREAEKQQALRDTQILKLAVFQKEHSACIRQTQVIQSLYFQVLRKRWSSIPKADETSNAWLFEPQLTSYSTWLNNGDGVFLIAGKAGSGKSTLMKYASEHESTLEALHKWAKPQMLYTASFFFWNQGFKLQKSQTGLFQSLLYQILRSSPNLVARLPKRQLEFEDWEMQDLQSAFRSLAGASMDSKFCFFIDGLDEYDGPEEDVVEMLGFLTKSPNIKICASTRFRSIFEQGIKDLRHIIVISDYTKADMAHHVRHTLQQNVKFQRLQASHPACEKIVAKIAENANGVWLWVFLVTRDLVHAVNRDEGVEKLQEITDEFPQGLNEYFKRMIDQIHPSYQADMARIFLIAIHELQPLPLFAFSLLDQEQRDPDYAIKARCQQIQYRDYVGLKSRISNRCGDLMVVENGPHPTFLDQPVDFLHRTVRDYLRDNYEKELRAKLNASFDPMLALCRTQLYLLKSLDSPNLGGKDTADINQVIGLTDELLYYAHEVERRVEDGGVSPTNAILDELDKVNSYHAAKSGMKKHWTHIRDDPIPRGMDTYYEPEHCSFLGLAVQARLVVYVRAKLTEDTDRLWKQGRPLLDYALRPRRNTPIGMPYHSQQDDPSVNIEMVRLLLQADPTPKETINSILHTHADRTVWELFLISCYEDINHNRAGIPDSLQEARYKACEALIRTGAKPDDFLITGAKKLYVTYVLQHAFGSKATVLWALMEEKKKEEVRSCRVM